MDGRPPEKGERTTATAAVIFEAQLGPCLDCMYGYAFSQLHNAADADDAVMIAAAKAWGGFGGFRKEASFRTWVMVILHNVTLDMLRTQRRSRSRLSVPDDDGGPDASEPADTRPSFEDSVMASIVVERALGALSPAVLRAVVLVDLFQYSQRETAKVLGVPRHVVAGWLAEGRAAIRRSVGIEPEDPLP